MILSRAVLAHIRQFTRARKNRANTSAILFPEYKIAYIPIPKAANTSIRAELLRLLDIEPDSVKKIPAFEGFTKLRFSQCEHLLTPDWFVFTVVRDPYQRIASAYLEKLKLEREKPFQPFAAMGLYNGCSFRRFLYAISLWPRAALNGHVMPQSQLLADALRLPHLHVYKLEHITADWPKAVKEIEARTGKSLRTLGHRNKGTNSTSWQSIYDPMSRKLVSRLYSEDFEAFGYESRP